MPLWFIPILALALTATQSLSLSIAAFSVWVYHVLLRLPHFLATYQISYGRGAHRAHFRERWFRYYVVPVGIFLGYGAALSDTHAALSPLQLTLLLVATLWGFQHIAMQNYGVLQIYHHREGTGAPRAPARLEKLTFYGVVVVLALQQHLLPWIYQVLEMTVHKDLWMALNLLASASVALLTLAFVILALRRGAIATPATLYFLFSLALMIRWPFYDELPPGTWFFIFNGHHCLAYLGLVFVVRWNEGQGSPRFSPKAIAVSFTKFALPLVGLSLGLVALLIIGLGLDPNQMTFHSLSGLFVAHYYLESMVWRFSQPHHRKATLPLLGRP